MRRGGGNCGCDLALAVVNASWVVHINHEQRTDAALLRATAAGDKRCFTTFVKRHQDGVFRYAVLLSGSRSEAEDVLQDTFISALRAAGTFRGTDARSWLLTTARRAFLSKRRRRAGEPETLQSLDALGADAGWGDATAFEGFYNMVERRQLLRSALDSLSEWDREVVLARDLEGLSAAQTAALLEISVAAVKSRLHRARLRLAAAVREQLALAPTPTEEPSN